MNAPEKIYLPTRDGQSDSIWNGHWTHGKDVEYIRADIHEAQIDALKAENAELREILQDAIISHMNSQRAVNLTMLLAFVAAWIIVIIIFL